MKDPKDTVRYLGFQALSDGSRRFDFSFSGPDASQHMISVEAPHDLFAGPGHMSIQECPGICHETLRVISPDAPHQFPFPSASRLPMSPDTEGLEGQ